MAKKPAKAATKKAPAGKAKPEIVQVLNVNAPGKTYPRNAEKYEACRKVFLKVIPKAGPGGTQSEMMALMKKALAGSDFGTTVGWWTKTVQLDAEAPGQVVRDGGKPLRWKRK